MGTRDTARGRYDGFDESRLTCYGCSSSALMEPWPGQPSGSRACTFCVRNPIQHLSEPSKRIWIDGTEPVSVPMDCYHSMDMMLQVSRWLVEAKKEDTEALQRALDVERKLREAKTDGSTGDTN